MKKQLFSFLLVVSFAASAAAQTAQTAPISTTGRNLRQHIEFLASPKLEGRRTGEAGAAAAAQYIAKQFSSLKLRPGVLDAGGKPGYLQRFSYDPFVQNPHGAPVDDKARAAAKLLDAYNVVGILEGRDKALKSEAIVIGAHYDHLGRGGQGSLAANSSEVHHGADDNASGTSAIIELARIFAKEKKNRRTIIFVAFSGEEEGLFGSKYYTNNAPFPIEKTVAMINLDMVGRLNENKLTIGGIGTATEWKALVEKTNSVPLTVSGGLGNKQQWSYPAEGSHFKLQLNEDGFGPSDHASFYMVKVPVLFLFTGTHLDYHKPSDTADKINYAGEEKIIEYVASIIRSVDQSPVRPTYAVAKSSNTGGRMGFNVSLGTIPSYTDSTDGMVLDGVREDSPASRAGLKRNDKIVSLAGKEIRNVQDYTMALGEMKAGETYEVIVLRGSDRLVLSIVPIKRQ